MFQETGNKILHFFSIWIEENCYRRKLLVKWLWKYVKYVKWQITNLFFFRNGERNKRRKHDLSLCDECVFVWEQQENAAVQFCWNKNVFWSLFYLIFSLFFDRMNKKQEKRKIVKVNFVSVDCK